MHANQRHVRLCVSDDSVMRDATIETHDLCVSVLRADTSRMRLSHVVQLLLSYESLEVNAINNQNETAI
jgi:hypothetical protein